MPVPSSSKLRPGYSLNFRHTAAPASDEAAARLPGFTIHIGLACEFLYFMLIFFSTTQDAEASRNLDRNQIVEMHARTFLMQLEWIVVFTMYFAISLIFPRASASYRWVAHLFALLALPVIALHSRCVLPTSVSYCQIFLMFVSYLDARLNSSFMRFLHRALCICAMLYLMLRRIIGT